MESTPGTSPRQMLWDDPEQPYEIAGAFAQLERLAITDAASEVGQVPGVYVVYAAIDGPDAYVYSDAVRTGLSAPAYIGSSEGDLRSRLHRHVRSLDEAAGVDPARTEVQFVETRTRWRALKLEAMLIEHHQSPWNVAVPGFGSNPQGGVRVRGQRIPLWDCLHPGRRGYAPSDIERAAAIAAMVHHLTLPHFYRVL